MNILIADDSEFMRMILKDIIKAAWPDAALSEVSNGQEALAAYQALHPDLILMDVMMPQKTGLDALKEMGPEAWVIIISAAGQDNIIDEAKKLGARDFIVKPFEAEKVVQTIKAVLGRAQSDAPSNSDVHG